MAELQRYPSNSRDFTKKEDQERKRNILYLIENFLRSSNLHETADCLQNEAQLSNNVEVCDNVDLDVILQEYQSYYFVKFQKMPKITKKSEDPKPKAGLASKKTTKRSSAKKITNTKEKSPSTESDDFQFEIINLTEGSNSKQAQPKFASVKTQDEKTALKPLCDFENYNQEWREFAEQIVKNVIPNNLGITFNDCIGLNKATALLKESVTYPILHPEIFKGIISPWRGILLFGPPGTGKTLLAKALASEHSIPFINVTSSCYVSKWRGESEKMVKVLFDIAKFNSPAVIFIDEIDALASNCGDYQHEASARFKSELLVNLDGILQGNEQVFVLAVTNSPWKLDSALLRRFEKRILIDVPNETTRMELFKHYFAENSVKLGTNELMILAEKTRNYSCSEIKLVCKEAMMSVVREKLQNVGNKNGSFKKENLRQPMLNDIVGAIDKVKTCINTDLIEKYRNWHENYGCM